MIDNWNKKEEANTISKANEEESTQNVVKTSSNHVYFYADVTTSSCLTLNKILEEKTEELLCLSLKTGIEKPKLFLHINSYGGSIFAGISSMDTILSLKKKIDIITIIEGVSASAGTFLSVVGTERWITENSFMLIHQLSSATIGKYRDLKDDIKNVDRLMVFIKNTYEKYSNVPMQEIDEILDHDIWWDAKTCKKHNLIDKIV